MKTIISFCAQYLVFVAPLILAIVWITLEPKMRRVLFLRTVIVAALGYAFAKIAGQAYYEPRPFIVLNVQPLVHHISDNGFPSDHTLVAFGCAFLLVSFSRPAAVLVAIIAGIVAWARIVSLLHSPIDIFASIILAAIATLLSVVLARQKPKSRKEFTKNDVVAGVSSR